MFMDNVELSSEGIFNRIQWLDILKEILIFLLF